MNKPKNVKIKASIFKVYGNNYLGFIFKEQLLLIKSALYLRLKVKASAKIAIFIMTAETFYVPFQVKIFMFVISIQLQ